MAAALFIFACLEVIFALLVWGWAMIIYHKKRELIRIEQANIAMASLIMIDTLGIIVNVNKEVARMFGYDTHEIIGQNVNILMTDLDKSEHDNYIRRFQETHKSKIIGKGRMVYGKKNDGTPFPVELTVSEMKDVDGTTKYYFGHLRDVTHEKWAEAIGLKM